MRSPFLQRLPDLPDVLPIFPLSGAVVLPGVQLPLNIFEPRYLAMVQAALASDHLVDMVQPRGQSAEEPSDIHRVGCAGRITSYSETHDGRIVLVLTGLCRFKVLDELPMQDGFRRVKPAWEDFATDLDDDETSLSERDAFMGSLRAFCDRRSVEIPWDDIDQMADPDLVNLLCSHLPLDAEDKQALLETVPLSDRATLMRGLMDMSAHASRLGTEHRH